MDVDSIAGSTVGKTSIDVSPEKSLANTYRYKTAASVTLPLYNDVLTSWTTWDGVAEITATTGNDISIAEVDASLKCKKVGKTTVVSKAE